VPSDIRIGVCSGIRRSSQKLITRSVVPGTHHHLGLGLSPSNIVPGLKAPPGNRLPSAAVVDAPTSTEFEDAKSEQTFQWEKCWYPVIPIDYLDKTRPTPLELLGKNLVIWCDASGAWSCAQDQCPHRLAPLSGGSSATPLLSMHPKWTSIGTCEGGDSQLTPSPPFTPCPSSRGSCGGWNSVVLLPWLAV
jgi:hypothetical protein